MNATATIIEDERLSLRAACSHQVRVEVAGRNAFQAALLNISADGLSRDNKRPGECRGRGHDSILCRSQGGSYRRVASGGCHWLSPYRTTRQRDGGCDR